MGGTNPLLSLPPGGVEAGEVEAFIWEFLLSSAFLELLVAFEGPARLSGELGTVLEALEAFSERWDFRGGRERNLVDEAAFSAHQAAVATSTAEQLGFVDGFAHPAHNSYDHCLILGGLLRACLARPLWARILTSADVRVQEITAAGGFRPLRGDEFELARKAGIAHTNEFGALEEGMRRAFDLSGEPDVEEDMIEDELNRSWSWRRFRTDDGIRVSVLAAPSSEPALRRANTADTYKFWAHKVASLGAGHRLLLVTAPIYAVYQHADAIRMLARRFGCGVDTVGTPTHITGGIPPKEFTPTNYLQEFRSTIRAFRALNDAFGEGR